MYKELHYQVKTNRPSGKPGSAVPLVTKASNHQWNRLIWILYYCEFHFVEAWEWPVNDYLLVFDSVNCFSPTHMRKGGG